MTQQVLLSIIVGIVGLLCIGALAIGTEKMIKIVLGNYVLSTICLALSQSLDLLVNFLNATPELKVLGMKYAAMGTFVANANTTIVLFVYIALLVVIYKNSKIHIHLPLDPTNQKGLHLLMVPITVISMILTLQIVVFGMNVIRPEELLAITDQITKNPALFTFLSWMPLWVFLHGVATVVITSELKIGLRTGV